MVIALFNLCRVAVCPSAAFLDLRERPRWVAAFLLFSLVTILTSLHTIPYAQHIAATTLAGKLDEDRIAQALELSQRMQVLGVLFAPVVLLGKWLLVGGMLFFVCVLLDGTEVKFGPLFAAVVNAESVLILMGIVNVALLSMKDPSAVTHPLELRATMGLDFLLADRAAHLPLTTLLAGINPFSLWHVAILSVGVSVSTGFSRVKSGSVVAFVWLLGVELQVVFATMGSALQSWDS